MIVVTESVWIALISTLGLIIVAVIGNGLISNRGRQHAKAARAQVENSHELNLRDDIDEKHDANVSRLEQIDGLATWQQSHQLQAERGYRRIVRLELLALPMLGAILVGIVHTIRRKNT